MAEDRAGVTLSRDQLRFIELLVARNNEGPTSIDLEDHGRNGVLVRLFDKTGHELGTHLVTPYDNELPY